MTVVRIAAIPFLCFLLSPHGSGTGSSDTQAGNSKSDAKYRLRIAKWESTAEIIRERKPVKDVKKGVLLEVGDAISTKTSKRIEIHAGAIGYHRLEPQTAVRYVSFRPVNLDPLRPSELELELSQGTILHRAGPKVAGSKYRSRSGPKIVASDGTAYSVSKTGEDLEVLVAEGDVSISLSSSPGQALAIGPRQKATVGAQLPATPSPVSREDERRIRELLSLPIANLIGYSDPENLRREDAERIVTLGVRPALLVESSASDKAKWRDFSIVVTGSNTFWSVSEDGDRKEIGKGLKFAGATKNGSVVLGLDLEENLVAQDYLGRKRRIIGKKVKKVLSLAPDGFAVVVDFERRFVESPEEGGRTRRIENRVVTGALGISAPFVRLAFFQAEEVQWLPGGGILGISRSGKITQVSRIDEPFGGLVTMRTIEWKIPLGVEGDWSIEVLPSGSWLVAQNAGDVRIIDLENGVEASFTGSPNVFELEGARAVLVEQGPGRRVVVERPSTPFSMQGNTPTLNQRAAVTDDFVKVLRMKRATSPNGELITYRGDKGTALVADSQNLARSSDTYVGIDEPYDCEWVAGDEVWYRYGPEKEPEEILIKLGIKELGAVPRGFSGPNVVPPPSSFEFDVSGLPFATEIIVTDVDSSGKAVGFIKIGGFPTGPFIVSSRFGGRAVPLGMPSLPCLPFTLLENGAILGNLFAILPDGEFVVPPPHLSESFQNGVDASGRMLIGGELWDPFVKDRQYPVGRGEPFAGLATALEAVPSTEAKVTSMSRNGDLLWEEPREKPNRRAWLSKPREKPKELGFTLSLFENLVLGEDGQMYISNVFSTGGVVNGNLFRVKHDGTRVPLLKDTPESVLLLRSVSSDGVAYGEMASPGSSDFRAFIVLDGEAISIAKLLPKGFEATQLRRITDRGYIAGAFTKDGKPVGYVPLLDDLIKRHRAVSGK